MKKPIVREKIKIPEDVDVSLSQNMVLVKGPLGKIERDFSHAPISIRHEGDEILVEASWPNKKSMAMVGTVRSHIRNMVTGVKKGFKYKLKIVYAHFPMSVKVSGKEVRVENFGGERKHRIIKVSDAVNVSVLGDDLVVKGIDIEEVSQAAASIQQMTRIKKKDPRIFLDGIYIYEKGEGI